MIYAQSERLLPSSSCRQLKIQQKVINNIMNRQNLSKNYDVKLNPDQQESNNTLLSQQKNNMFQAQDRLKIKHITDKYCHFKSDKDIRFIIDTKKAIERSIKQKIVIKKDESIEYDDLDYNKQIKDIPMMGFSFQPKMRHQYYMDLTEEQSRNYNDVVQNYMVKKFKLRHKQNNLLIKNRSHKSLMNDNDQGRKLQSQFSLQRILRCHSTNDSKQKIMDNINGQVSIVHSNSAQQLHNHKFNDTDKNIRWNPFFNHNKLSQKLFQKIQKRKQYLKQSLDNNSEEYDKNNNQNYSTQEIYQNNQKHFNQDSFTQKKSLAQRRNIKQQTSIIAQNSVIVEEKANLSMINSLDTVKEPTPLQIQTLRQNFKRNSSRSQNSFLMQKNKMSPGYRKPSDVISQLSQSNSCLSINSKQRQFNFFRTKQKIFDKKLAQALVNAWNSEDKAYQKMQTAKRKELEKIISKKVLSFQILQNCKHKLLILCLKMMRCRMSAEFFQSRKEKVFSSTPYERNGSFIFLKSCKYNNIETIKDMSNKNSLYIYDFNDLGQTALHIAVQNGNSKLAQYYIERGADYDAKDIAGRSPLYYAISKGDFQCVRLLIMSLADPWSPNGNNYLEMLKDQNIQFWIKRARKFWIYMKISSISQRQQMRNNIHSYFYAKQD